jgi:saccharopine dehydrogenase-like NADP-dependent oxidoreductase
LSASTLIKYLLERSVAESWHLDVVDQDLDLIQAKIGAHPNTTAHSFNALDSQQRLPYIAQADLVISMLPAVYHVEVAKDCIALKKHLLTASYIDEKIKANAATIKENNLLFLCEMGLDPGIDHMSAMKLIDEIHAKGGIITSFKSHCGGLIAPESDNNPWHYKISWNPRNIILAGKAGATYRSEQKNISVTYEDLFNTKNIIETPNGIIANNEKNDALSLYR